MALCFSGCQVHHRFFPFTASAELLLEDLAVWLPVVLHSCTRVFDNHSTLNRISARGNSSSTSSLNQPPNHRRRLKRNSCSAAWNVVSFIAGVVVGPLPVCSDPVARSVGPQLRSTSNHVIIPFRPIPLLPAGPIDYVK